MCTLRLLLRKKFKDPLTKCCKMIQPSCVIILLEVFFRVTFIGVMLQF